MPGMPRVGKGSDSISSGFVRGGGGKSALVVVGVVGDPHGHTARGRLAQRRRHDVARLTGQAHVVQGEVERALRRCDESRRAPCQLERGLLARVQGNDLDHAKRKPVAAGSMRIGLDGMPSGSAGLLKPPGATSLGVSGWNSAARYWMWSRPTPSSVWPPP